MNAATVAWIATVLVGTVLAFYGLVEARRDLDALRLIPRNGRWMIARHQLVRYGLRLGMYGTSIGAVAVLGVAPDVIPWLLVLDRVLLGMSTASDLITAAFMRRGVRRQVQDEMAKGS